MARERRQRRKFYRIPRLEQRDPDAYVALLKDWLRACDEKHDSECHAPPVSERPHYAIPDWVIDTEVGCIVPGHNVQQYVALSYTWGSPRTFDEQPTARLVLNRSNLNDFQQPGYLWKDALHRTPSIIRDSIELVRRSGTRYLWVDCICILQNDKTTRDRISRMNEVYSGALFTIIAANDNYFGIYRTPCDGYNYTTDGYLNVLDLQGNLLNSNWASRGWTFQEHLLSRRCLIFMRDIVFWECQGDTWCPKAVGEVDWDDESDAGSPFGTSHKNNNKEGESHSNKDDSRGGEEEEGREVIGSEEKQGKAEDSSNTGVLPTSPITLSFHEVVHPMVVAALAKNKAASQKLISARTIPDFALYIELVCRYTNRRFTYEQDVLAGFSGILNEFAHSFHGGFISGLPALFLDAALLWQPLLKAQRRTRVEDLQQHSSSSPLPSWSWAGWRCLLDPQSLDSGQSYSQDVEDKNLWLTEKLVDWHTLSDDELQQSIDEPSVLHNYKAFGVTPSPHTSLSGWSREPVLVPTSKKESSVMSWFVHDSLPEAGYRHPVPLGNASPGQLSERNYAKLTCITTKVLLTARKELYAEGDYTLRPKRTKQDGLRYARFCSRKLHHSVLQTTQYNFDFEPGEMCPVVTLEDGHGRWAGTLRIMDRNTWVPARAKLQMIAISTGSAPFLSAANSYSEKIDATATFTFTPGRTKTFQCRDPNVEWVPFSFKETFSNSSEAEEYQNFSSSEEENNVSEFGKSRLSSDKEDQNTSESEERSNQGEKRSIPPHQLQWVTEQQSSNRDRNNFHEETKHPRRYSGYLARHGQSHEREDHVSIQSCPLRSRFARQYSCSSNSDDDELSSFSGLISKELPSCDGLRKSTLDEDSSERGCSDSDQESCHARRGTSSRTRDGQSSEARRSARNQEKPRPNSSLDNDLFTVADPDIQALTRMASRNRRRAARIRRTTKSSVKIGEGERRPIMPTYDTVQAGVDPEFDGDDDAPPQPEAIDHGPFYEYWRQSARGHEDCLPDEFKKFDPYVFYNVLWVETIDGVMYRKAAGRVLKEVWEANCGEPERIVLG